MNKQRPYRGKRVDNREWVKGEKVTLYYPKHICIARKGTNQNWANTEFVEVDPATVGQSAGLCDKNGKELYEGDKFKGLLDFGPGGYAEREGVVGFDDIGGYQWEYWDLGTIEVIGNIHDEEASDE